MRRAAIVACVAAGVLAAAVIFSGPAWLGDVIAGASGLILACIVILIADAIEARLSKRSGP